MNFPEIVSDIIVNAGIAQGFLMAILYPRSGNRNSRTLLTLLLVAFSVIIFRQQYLTYYLFDQIGPHFVLSGPFMFLLGPLFFLYLRSIVNPEISISKNDAIHFLLFVIFLFMMLSLFVFGKDGTLSSILQRAVGSPWIFLVLQFGYYLIKAQGLLRMHRDSIEEKYSNVEGMDVNWIRVIIWVFIIILLFITIASPTLIHGIGFETYYKTSPLFFSFVLFFVTYKGMQVKVPVEPVSTLENGSDISDSETILELKAKLLTHMEAAKPYLNPELTLVDLAKQMKISRNQLSQVINTGVGDNFYHFINTYRIEEVKALIKKDAAKQYTILSLASDAGFNSKSAFNNIFKKLTGLTPSEYRDGQS